MNDQVPSPPTFDDYGYTDKERNHVRMVAAEIAARATNIERSAPSEQAHYVIAIAKKIENYILTGE